MSARRRAAVVLAVCGITIGAVGCASDDAGDSGAVTDLGEVGPELARLRAEVSQLRLEVRELREEVASATGATTTTAPLR